MDAPRGLAEGQPADARASQNAAVDEAAHVLHEPRAVYGAGAVVARHGVQPPCREAARQQELADERVEGPGVPIPPLSTRRWRRCRGCG